MASRSPEGFRGVELDYHAMIMPESPIEKGIVDDLVWQEGVALGIPRPGHLEGNVVFHIVDVLKNIDALPDISSLEREQLRLIAIVHDTFKHKVDYLKRRVGANHHGFLARQFAERYTKDPSVLLIIQLHDDAFNAWAQGNRAEQAGKASQWEDAERRVKKLIVALGDSLRLYSLFYQCDNETGIKDQACFAWFQNLIQKKYA